MGNGSVMKVLLALAIPSVLMVLFHSFAHLVDTLFISWVGANDMIAISYMFPVQLGLFAILEGIGNGVASITAHKLGADDADGAAYTAKAGVLLAYATALLTLFLTNRFLAAHFFALLGLRDPEILFLTWQYNIWLPLTFIFAAYTFVASAVLRSHGNTVTPLKSFLIANVVNIILDPIFIFVFDWGLAGAAVATLTGRFLGAIYLYDKLKMDNSLYLHVFPTVFSWKAFSTACEIVRIGFPVTITTSSIALGIGSVNKIITGAFGSQAVAAWMLGMKLEDIVLATLVGINDALVPFLAYNYGRRDRQRMRAGIRFSFILSAILSGIIGLAVGIFPLSVLSIFHTTAEITHVATQALRITLAGYPLVIYIIIYNSLFIATGYSIYGTIAQVSRAFILRIPLALSLSKIVSIDYIWWFQPVSFAGAAVMTAYFGRQVIKKTGMDEMNDMEVFDEQ